MIILIDGRLYGLENAGLGRYVVNLVANLTKLDDKNDYVIFLRKKYFDTLTLPKNWKKVLADFRHYSFKEQLFLPGLIKKENPDLVHFPHFNVPIFYGGKYIVTIHDLLMHKQKGLEATTLPTIFYLIKRLGYNLAFRIAVKKSFSILAPSQSVKNELINYYKISSQKIIVTYEGVDENISFRGNIELPKQYFVYAGNAYPHKNLKRLIQAIVALNKVSEKKNTLIIASARNNFTQRVEKIVKDLNAEHFVKMLGFVPDDQLGSVYKNSLGFVFPSLSEGFGLPGLEALNVGTILLASEIPVFREIYKDHAVYFNPMDFSSIEKAMQNVIELDQDKRKEMILSGQKFVKNYSWAKMAKQTLDVYKECIQKQSSNSLRSG